MGNGRIIRSSSRVYEIDGGYSMTPPTEREWGQTIAELKQLEHSLRNLKMVVESLFIDSAELRAEVAKLRVQIKTVLSVVAGACGVVGWLVGALR